MLRHLECLSLSACPQLGKLACWAMSKMLCDSDVHHNMLEKACMDGDMTMAGCLIELCTNVTRKTKNESLIYQVRIENPVQLYFSSDWKLGAFDEVVLQSSFCTCDFSDV